MTPTPKLRFVERQGKPHPFFINAITGKPETPTYTVLQQWYAYDIDYPTEKGEWRDVPMEKEQ
jgi:hypothetical protein